LNREPPEQVAAVCPVTGLARLIQRQEFGISRHAGHLTFMTVMRVMKRGGRRVNRSESVLFLVANRWQKITRAFA
jgi:hypothetical protein